MIDELTRQKAYEVLERKVAEENKKSATEMSKKGRYKIQLWFRSTRSMLKPVEFTLSAWESGKRMHGGGDEMMFVCKRHVDAPKVAPFEVAMAHRASASDRGCGNFIPGGLTSQGRVVCPHCMVAHRTDQIGDSVYYSSTLDQAADVLADWWRRLDGDADVYLKYHPEDPRVKMMAKGFSARKARMKKGLTIYPLANIIKDTSAGSSVRNRFLALLKA